MGCRAFCCRLLVRLYPDEREPTEDGTPEKGFVDKNPDGLCIHFDRETLRCKNWQRRPRLCREYDCNNDFLLQVALREGFDSITDLVIKANKANISEENYIKVPLIKSA